MRLRFSRKNEPSVLYTRSCERFWNKVRNGEFKLAANGATRVSETKSGRLSSSRRLLQEHSTCVFESQFRVNYQW